MTNKVVALKDAFHGLSDGATIAIGGFGDAGSPVDLLEELARRAPRGLTVVSNNAGGAAGGLAELLRAGSVAKVICSFPRQRDRTVFDDLYERGRVGLEVVPQGTLVERLRCASAGLAGVYTRTGAGTELARDKELRTFDGREYLLEKALHVDWALIQAHEADRWGNLTYRKAARNFNPVMAGAAATTVAQTSVVCALGALDPERIITPSVLVDRVVEVAP